AAGPHTGNAQFYINLVDNPELDPLPTRWGYAVFGQVVEGMDVVDRIGVVPTGTFGPFKSDAPLKPVIIQTVELITPPQLSSPAPGAPPGTPPSGAPPSGTSPPGAPQSTQPGSPQSSPPPGSPQTPPGSPPPATPKPAAPPSATPPATPPSVTPPASQPKSQASEADQPNGASPLR